MPRPCRCRWIAVHPSCRRFIPAGGPPTDFHEILLGLDELEAMRLADLEGLYQEQAAQRMNVSRQTFARIVESARKKVAQALVEGKALRIEGGPVEMLPMRTFVCCDCQNQWQVPHGTARPHTCPRCGSRNIHRPTQERRGWRWCSRQGGRGRGQC